MYSSLALSTFSHMSPMHLLFNMMALYSLSHSLESLLGAEQFLAFYLTSGFLSAYLSSNLKVFSSIIRPSLGAVRFYCFSILFL